MILVGGSTDRRSKIDPSPKEGQEASQRGDSDGARCHGAVLDQEVHGVAETAVEDSISWVCEEAFDLGVVEQSQQLVYFFPVHCCKGFSRHSVCMMIAQLSTFIIGHDASLVERVAVSVCREDKFAI